MSTGNKGKQLLSPPFSENNFPRPFFLFPLSLFFPFLVSISTELVLKLPFFPHSPLSNWSTTKMQDRGECEGALEFHMQRVNTATARKTYTQKQTQHLRGWPNLISSNSTQALLHCPLNYSHYSLPGLVIPEL